MPMGEGAAGWVYQPQDYAPEPAIQNGPYWLSVVEPPCTIGHLKYFTFSISVTLTFNLTAKNKQETQHMEPNHVAVHVVAWG